MNRYSSWLGFLKDSDNHDDITQPVRIYFLPPPMPHMGLHDQCQYELAKELEHKFTEIRRKYDWKITELRLGELRQNSIYYSALLTKKSREDYEREKVYEADYEFLMQTAAESAQWFRDYANAALKNSVLVIAETRPYYYDEK